MEDVGYSGQYLDNKEFRIKVRTGANIQNATGDAICGEMFLVTGANPAFYVATSTSSDSTQGIYHVMDLIEQVLPVSDIKDIQLGFGSVHVLTHGGDVWSAGDNSQGQLGDDTGSDSLTFVKALISDVSEISVASGTVFFLKTNGELWGTGLNNYKQIKYGISTPSTYMKPEYTGLSGILKVSSSLYHVIYIKAIDGKLYGKGSNSNKQLGHPSDPVMDDTLIYNGSVSYIHAGNIASFFVDTSGNLNGIGSSVDLFGGITPTTAQQGGTFLHSNILSSVSKAKSTTFNTLILKTNGELWGCGQNNSGELGLGNQTSQTSPAFISSDVSDVFASNNSTFFITTNGELKGMGPNNSQELGNIGINILTPQLVDSNVSRGTTRSGSIIYQKNNKDLYAGGKNSHGQLGLGNTSTPISPKQLLTLPFL